MPDAAPPKQHDGSAGEAGLAVPTKVFHSFVLAHPLHGGPLLVLDGSGWPLFPTVD